MNEKTNTDFAFTVGMTGVTRDGSEYRVIGIADAEQTDGETLVVEVDGELALYFADGGYFNYGDRSEYSLRAPVRHVHIVEGCQGGVSGLLAFYDRAKAEAAVELAAEMALTAKAGGRPEFTTRLYTVELPQ